MSHIFFVDDLVLFGKSSIHQMNVISNCLDNFYLASSAKVNTTTTKVYFSKNTSISLKRKICSLMGFEHVNCLGKYLGVPLIESHVKTEHFSFILSKIRKKLCGWTCSKLSFVGRATLINSFLNSILAHIMQTKDLPLGFCREIDNITRRFLWGSLDDAKKIHLMNWSTVCQDKNNGGLGLKPAELVNKAYLVRLG